MASGMGLGGGTLIAVVTSREAEPGKSKWLTSNDLAKSSSWLISQTIRNKAMKKQKTPGKLLIYSPINTISFKKQNFFTSRKHADFEIAQLKMQ